LARAFSVVNIHLMRARSALRRLSQAAVSATSRRIPPISWIGLSSKQTTGRFGSRGSARDRAHPPCADIFRVDLRNAPHVLARRGLRSFSARRRRTVPRDRLSSAVSLTSAFASNVSVQRAQPAGGLEQRLPPAAPPQKCQKLVAFVLGQLDTMAYIHRSLLVGDPDESTDEANVWQRQTQLHAQAGPISGLHRCVHACEPTAPRRMGDATALRRDPAFGPPDDPHPRTRRPRPTSTRRAAQHRGSRSPEHLPILQAHMQSVKNLGDEGLAQMLPLELIPPYSGDRRM
jgi:hypothetical protein